MFDRLIAGPTVRSAHLPKPGVGLRWPTAASVPPLRSTLVLGLGAVLLMALVGWLADGLLVGFMLDQAASRAADEVQLGLVDRVTAADFGPPFDADHLQDVALRLDPVVGRLRASGSGILRVNVIARDGTILYSDLEAIRGRTIAVRDKPELGTALGGGIGAHEETLNSPENGDLGPGYGRALEVYVPVRLEGQVIGAYEIYEDVGQLRLARSLLWGGLFGLGCVAAVVWYLVRSARRSAPTPDALRRSAPAPDAPRPSLTPVATANAGRYWRVRLTPRELDVLRLMATSHTNRDIAEQLCVSEETVRSHVKRILHKLDQPDRTQAVLAAVRAGLLELP